MRPAEFPPPLKCTPTVDVVDTAVPIREDALMLTPELFAVKAMLPLLAVFVPASPEPLNARPPVLSVIDALPVMDVPVPPRRYLPSECQRQHPSRGRRRRHWNLRT